MFHGREEFMRVIQMETGFWNFQFPEADGFDYGFNLYALLDRNRVLLIDTAFRSQIREVKEYLTENGLELTHILATHFHNDHIAGLMSLSGDITVLGSPEYRKTLTKNIPQKVTAVSFSEPLFFGDFTLNFTAAPGHSPCSILTDINKQYTHAGDNLMSRYDGKRILPWVEKKYIRDHIGTLELLKSLEKNRVLLSHGPEITDRNRIAEEIDMRLCYLRAVDNADNSLTLEQALPDSAENWTATEFFNQLMESSSDRK